MALASPNSAAAALRRSSTEPEDWVPFEVADFDAVGFDVAEVFVTTGVEDASFFAARFFLAAALSAPRTL